MYNVKHFQALMLVAFTAALKLTCDPGEEFKSHNLTCDISQCNKSVVCVTPFKWQKRTTIASCSPSPVFSPSSNCEDKPSYHYNVDFIGTTYILTIMNVTRPVNTTLQTTERYTCADQGSNKQICDFSIYARPESVTCQDPVIDKPNNIKVSCTATKIYPSPVCQFYWMKNGTNESLVGHNISYHNMDPQGDPTYYNPTCILTLPAYNLGLGSHQFRVSVYPDVTGSTNDVIYGRDSDWTTTKTINNPTVRLECPQGYIQENKQYSCSCRETNNTFVSANIIVGQGPANLSSGQGLIIYNFTATRNMGDITCLATVFNLQSSPEKYTPNVAYGPNSATLIYNQTTTNVIHLCNNALSVTVICKVDEVAPGVVYQFNFNGSVVQTNNISTSTQHVTNGGQLSVFCTGINSVFYEMKITSLHLQLQVIEPPPSPPIIERYQEGSSPVAVTNGILAVQEGTNKIRCRVDGGYPLVSSLTVTCGSQTLTVVGNMAVLDVNMSRYDSECSCIAVHNSTCYTNKTTTKLDVQFAPEVLSFMVNENTDQAEITVKKDFDIMFSCLAEGNPSPDLSIIKDRVQLASYPDQSLQKFNLSLKFNKTIKDCRDAGVYSCLAKKGQNVVNKSVDVNVICPQQLEDPANENKIHKTKVNGSIDINISVIGYPAPTLELYSAHPLKKEAYSLTYSRQRPSFGIVYLKINTVTIKDYQKYSLNISNSEGTLVYNFEIQEGDPNDEEPSYLGAIVGGIVAGVLVILITAIIVVCLKRKKKICYNKHEPDNYNSNTSLHRDRDTTGNDRGRKQGKANDEDVFDNSDLYNLNRKQDEVVEFDNSDLYNLNRKSEEVVFDNSDLYNLNKKPNDDKTGQDSLYRSYSTVTPTITSASTAPKNMTLKKTPAITTAYEDVSIDGASANKTKPFVALKPKPKPRPKSGHEKNPQAFMVNSRPEETYATVVKVAKPNKPEVVAEEKRPSIPPEIPDKSFENTEVVFDNSDLYNLNKKPNEDGRDSKLFVYNNMGFSKLEDDHNVYANDYK